MTERAKIVYTSDLHGDVALYRQLFDLAANQAADALLVGGDLGPKDGVLWGDTSEQRDFIVDFLNPAIIDLRRKVPGLAPYLLMGNVDWAVNMDVLELGEEEGLYRVLHMKSHELIPGWWVAGYSCVPLTPFVIQDWDRRDLADLRRKEAANALYHGRSLNSIEEDMEILSQMSDPRRTIYVMHSPPHGTNLDRMYDQRSIGSRAIRHFIETHQPPASLHGHIHESPRVSGCYWDRLGETLSINPGQGSWVAGQRKLHAVVFELNGVVEGVEHTLFGPMDEKVGC